MPAGNQAREASVFFFSEVCCYADVAVESIAFYGVFLYNLTSDYFPALLAKGRGRRFCQAFLVSR
jgi:hypothetical protein